MGVIFVFGDSIVLGKGKLTSWAEILKREYGLLNHANIVYNLGVSGENSSGLLERIGPDIENRLKCVKEDDVKIFIAVGMNDLKAINSPEKHQTDINTFRENLRKIIGIARKYASDVFLVDINKVDEETSAPFINFYFTNRAVDEYNEILYSVAEEKSVCLVKTEFGEDPKDLLFDGVHPNEKGCRRIFNKVWEKLNAKC